MNSYVDKLKNSKRKQLGTVLIFKEGTSEAEIQQKLKAISSILEYQPRVNSFNPDWGSPVWYIP